MTITKSIFTLVLDKFFEKEIHLLAKDVELFQYNVENMFNCDWIFVLGMCVLPVCRKRSEINLRKLTFNFRIVK